MIQNYKRDLLIYATAKSGLCKIWTLAQLYQNARLWLMGDAGQSADVKCQQCVKRIVILETFFSFFGPECSPPSNGYLGPVSRKSRELFGPEKPFVKLRTAYSVKLVFSYVINRSQIKIAAKFRASRGLRFEDTKRIMSPEMRPKSFGTFEKQVPGPVQSPSDPSFTPWTN